MNLRGWLVNLLGGELTHQASARANSDDFWYTDTASGLSASGVKVTPDSSMQVSAVGACIRLISGTVAKLPLHEYERDDGDGRSRVRNGPIESLFRNPNEYQSWFEFRRTMTANLALRGNAYAQIVPGPGGFASQLIPLQNSQVRPYGNATGGVAYSVLTRDGWQQWDRSRIFHLRDLSLDGITGLSRIQQHAQGIGLAAAAELYTSAVFGNNADFGTIIIAKDGLDNDQFKRLRAALRGKTGAAKAGKHLILNGNVEIEKSRFTNVEAQTFELRSFQVSDIARIFGVPEHLIGQQEKQTSWGTGVEQQNIGFLTFSLMDWLVLWEAAIERDLIVDPETRFAEHKVDGLLRGDFRTRMEGYQIAIQNGLMSPDEARARENMNPRPDGLGGRFWRPANIQVDEEQPATPVPAPAAVRQFPARDSTGGTP